MTRRLLNLLTALSLLLCVVACVLWARSYGRMDSLQQESRLIGAWSGLRVESNHGVLTLCRRVIQRLPSDDREWTTSSELAIDLALLDALRASNGALLLRITRYG